MTGLMGKAALALAVAMALVGCGSDDAVRENTTAVRSTGAAVAAAFSPRRRAAAPAGLPAIERRAIDASTTPIRVITVEKVGASVVVLELSRNGDVTVFATGDGNQFAFRDGVLVATRGLGVDLMSAAVPSAATLRRGEGTHLRSYFTLTGIDATRRVDLQCTVATAGRETLALYGLSVPVTVVVETCAGAGQTVENRYWFDNRGRIRQSREWINGTLEYIGVIDPMR
jgi:hypothetical protein